MELIAPFIPVFIIVLLRSGIAVSMLPLFGSSNAPAVFKIGLAVTISMVITPVVPVSVTQAEVPGLVFREVVLGAAIGGAARSLFYAVEMAGQIASNAMGLSIATVFNPEMGQSTEVARLYGLVALLIFLASDGHHDLLALFVRSYEALPPGTADLGSIASNVLTSGAKLFGIALTLAAPVVVMMILVNLLLGFLAKAAPQMNVFFVGYPVYLFVGVLVMFLGMPIFVHAVTTNIDLMRDAVVRIIAGAGR